MKYWNIYEILPYQRNFNFINGPRSIGKTYTCQKYVLDRCITNGWEFIYITRTKDNKTSGIFPSTFEKVISQEFSEIEFKFTTESLDMIVDDDSHINLGYCIALTEYQKIKPRSFPNVRFIIFDEYMLEESSFNRYINGVKEPDLFLSIYHTVDRERDIVKCFLLGNNTSFYNPYHMHKAFRIPYIDDGKIWYNKFVLYQRAKPSEELKECKEKSSFWKMINDSDYGKFANSGNFTEDKYDFIQQLSSNTRYIMTILYNNYEIGVYLDNENNKAICSQKIDPYCRCIYALTLDSYNENALLNHNVGLLKWLSDRFKKGLVYFDCMETKQIAQEAIYKLL